MSLQAEVSGDQGHNARTDIEPVRMDTGKKSITCWRLSVLQVNQVLVWSHQRIR